MPPGQQPPYAQPTYVQPPTYPPVYHMGYAPPPPSRKTGMRWWGWLLIAGGVLLVGCCCVGGMAMALRGAGPSRITTGSAPGAPSSVASTATAAARNYANVGDTITADGVSCTLVSARIVPGDQYFKPDAGNVFVIVTVKIVNNSSSEFGYNQYDFNAESGTGNLRHPEWFFPDLVAGITRLKDGTLAIGGTVQGDILFQVPKDDHQARLTWQPRFYSDRTSNVWLLGI